MTQQGFEDFIYTAYSNKSGAAKSYILVKFKPNQKLLARHRELLVE